MPKQSRRTNMFASLPTLDSDDDEKAVFQLGTSILGARRPRADIGSGDAARTVGPLAPAAAAVSATSVIAAAAAATLRSSSATLLLDSVAASASAAPSLDLAAVTDELLSTAAARPATVAEAAWDFSGLSSTAEDATRKLAADTAETEARQRMTEARLAAMESDKLLLREKLDRTDMTSKQRARKGQSVRLGEDVNGKLRVKAAKSAAAKKMRNAAKNLY